MEFWSRRREKNTTLEKQSDFYPIKRDFQYRPLSFKVNAEPDGQDEMKDAQWWVGVIARQVKSDIFKSFFILLSMCILNNIDECFILFTREKHKINTTKYFYMYVCIYTSIVHLAWFSYRCRSKQTCPDRWSRSRVRCLVGGEFLDATNKHLSRSLEFRWSYFDDIREIFAVVGNGT